MVRPGGYLLYATCTFAPEENEGVIGHFLRAHPDFEVVDVPQTAPVSPPGDTGHPEWVGETDLRLRRAIRLWPHRGPGRGHFYALLRRDGDEHPRRPGPRTRLPGRARALYNEFVRQALQDPPPDEGLLVLGNHLYHTVVPPEMWEGPEGVSSGMAVGTDGGDGLRALPRPGNGDPARGRPDGSPAGTQRPRPPIFSARGDHSRP
jgi:hypothetical protein